MPNSAQYLKQWRAANPGKNASYKKAQRARNPLKTREQRKRYYLADPALARARVEDWLRRNPDFLLVKQAKYQLARALGVRIREIPQALALAKAEQLRVKRELRRQRREA